MINIGLKYNGYISEFKEYNYILEIVIPYLKRCFLLIVFIDLQAIIRIFKI
jgi:hypothetical protein